MISALPASWTCSDARYRAVSLATKQDITTQAGLALYRRIVAEYAARYALATEDVLGYLRRNGVTSVAAAEDMGRILAAHMDGLGDVLVPDVGAAAELSLVNGYSAVVSAGANAFEMVDEHAVGWLTRNTTYWITDKSGPRLATEIADVVERKVLQQGLSTSVAGEELKKLLGKQLVRDDLYWRGLAGNAATTARNFGAVDAMQDIGARAYIIYTQLDERVCEICGSMDRMEFPVAAAVQMRDAMLATEDPALVKEIHPWHTLSGDRSSPEAVLAMDGHMPPFHFLCRCYVLLG